VLLVAALGGFAVLTFFTTKWVLGNSISSRADEVDIASFAVQLAPSDPQTRYSRAVLLNRTLDPSDTLTALQELEAATALSPHNYLLWLELGKALERNGEGERAIGAFREAKNLAPNYSITQWSLGNALLRQGEVAIALPHIIAAAESNPSYAEPAASMIWQLAEGDLASVRTALLNAPMTSSRLIPILGREKKLDEALAMWDQLISARNPKDHSDIGRALYDQLIESHRYREALRVLSGTSNGELAEHKISSIFDGGFESRALNENRSVFEWRYAADPRMGLTDGNKRSGNYSFLIGFPAGTTSIKNLAQTVAVEPGQAYQFEIYSRSDLKTNGTVKWEIINGADGKRLAVTDAIVPSSDWMLSRAIFKMPTDSDGVEFRLIKECTTATCTIEGNLWLDDASLKQTDQ
jgi:Flp pilus assembly protein TadD, contains TPR repeats